jgi:DNA polymerase-1
VALSRSDRVLDMVTSAKALVVDTETTGVDPLTDRLVGWVFATEGESHYVPVAHTGGGNRFDDPAPWHRALQAAFKERTRLGYLTIGHRLPFDLWFAAKAGVIIDGPFEDTQLNEILIQDNLRAYDLDASAERRGVPMKAGAALYAKLAERFGTKRTAGRSNMKYFHLLPGSDRDAQAYAKSDGVATWELWKAQQEALDDLELRPVHRLECALIPHLARARRAGIRIDLPGLDQAFEALEIERVNAMRFLPDNFDIGKKDQIREYLFDQGYEENDFERTPTGKLSTAKKTLKNFGEAGERILRLRTATSTKTSFMTPLERARATGYIHPELVQWETEFGTGTHTGRFSCTDPNLQAFPRRNEAVGRIVRPLFIPDDGYDFGEADVRQQEPRLFAVYGNERSLLDGYNANPPTDIHSIAAMHMGLERDYAKTLILSIFNGMGATGLAERLGAEYGEAERLLALFARTFPGIAAFRRNAQNVAYARGWVQTIYGRRANFGQFDHHKAVSRIIQGSGADQIKLLLLRAFEYCEAYPQVQVLLSIHDSVVFQRRRGFDLTEFQRVMEDNSVLGLPLPFPMDVKIGRHWGECSYPHLFAMAEAA